MDVVLCHVIGMLGQDFGVVAPMILELLSALEIVGVVHAGTRFAFCLPNSAQDRRLNSGEQWHNIGVAYIFKLHG